MAEPSGVPPLLPAIPPPPARTAENAPLTTPEDDVLASWIELLIADGLVPGLILPPL